MMNLYYVTGYYYADWTLDYLIYLDMAHKEGEKTVVDTHPIDWDQTWPFGEQFEPYQMPHWGKSVADVRRQIEALDLPWVEMPTIEEADEQTTEYERMLKIGAPMLPGLEQKR